MSPRIPYVPADIQGSIPDAIRSRRKGELLDLDRTLLHNPAIAAGWNALLDAIRSKTGLSQSEKEIAICYVAVLNGATYEWEQHAPLAIKGGVSPHLMESLKRGNIADFDERHHLVLQVTHAMTKNIVLEEPLFQAAVNIFGESCTHDLIAITATYNMVSRYLVALKVGQ